MPVEMLSSSDEEVDPDPNGSVQMAQRRDSSVIVIDESPLIADSGNGDVSGSSSSMSDDIFFPRFFAYTMR